MGGKITSDDRFFQREKKNDSLINISQWNTFVERSVINCWNEGKYFNRFEKFRSWWREVTSKILNGNGLTLSSDEWERERYLLEKASNNWKSCSRSYLIKFDKNWLKISFKRWKSSPSNIDFRSKYLCREKKERLWNFSKFHQWWKENYLFHVWRWFCSKSPRTFGSINGEWLRDWFSSGYWNISSFSSFLFQMIFKCITISFSVFLLDWIHHFISLIVAKSILSINRSLISS